MLTEFKAIGLAMACLGLMGAGTVSAQSRDCMRNLAGETICPPARTQCLSERDNPTIKCSPPDGGIMNDRYGKATCGTGACVADARGDVFCSKTPAGAAGTSMYGDAVCTGGCEPGQAARCTVLTK